MAIFKDFRISVGDDDEHEELTAEIYFHESFLAMVSQERGFENLKLEIFPSPSSEVWEFKLDDFIEVIDISKKRFWEFKNIE